MPKKAKDKESEKRGRMKPIRKKKREMNWLGLAEG